MPQATPAPRTGDAVVVDGSGDQLWRFMDLNLDGDWNDAGEIVSYFVSAPGIVLGNPTAVAVGPDGAVFVADSTNDQVVRLRDLDGDGVATGPGEAVVFFSAAGNLSGVTMPSPLGLTVSGDGAVWVANSNTSTVGNDSVIRLTDGNGDGDAQDAGEAIEYAIFAPGAATGVSIPSAVAVGADGAVYAVENGTGGKGILRLHDDQIPNGVCTDGGEITAFYLPANPAPTPPQQCWGIVADRNGSFWLTETQYDRILMVNDLDQSLSIGLGTAEETTFFTATTVPSTLWAAAVASEGSLYAVEDGGTGVGDKVYRLTDLDGNGDAQSVGESLTVYDDTVASVDLASIRAIAFLKAPFIGVLPNPVPIGTTVTFHAEAGGGEMINVWASLFPGTFVVPPYGTVGLALGTPGTYFELLAPGYFGPGGSVDFPVFVPADPALLLATFHLQAIGGPPGRLLVSNVEVVTFM